MTTYEIMLRFPDGDRVIGGDSRETILEAAHRQGIPLVAECRLGLCGTCRAIKLAGKVAMDEEEPEGLTIRDRRANAILCCQSYAQSDLDIKFSYPLSSLERIASFEVEAPVVAIDRLAGSVVRLVVDTSGLSRIKFKPGQYAHIAVPGTGQNRSYSFSSSPHEDSRLAFLIRVLPSGVMSEYLRCRAKIGDRLTIGGPYGSFFLRESRAPLLFVAGGTGLGPFLSMLEALIASDDCDRPVRLLYGVTSRTADLSCLEQLEQCRSQLGDFTYEVVVADPDPEWRGPRGFVTTLLRDEHLFGGAAEAYLCGPPLMVEAGMKWLNEHGLSMDSVHFERFVAN